MTSATALKFPVAPGHQMYTSGVSNGEDAYARLLPNILLEARVRRYRWARLSVMLNISLLFFTKPRVYRSKHIWVNQLKTVGYFNMTDTERFGFALQTSFILEGLLER